MILEGNNPAIEEQDDLNTTAPQSQPDEWRMPEPVFRRTSGKLPQGFAKTVEGDAADNSVPPADAAAQPSAPQISPPLIRPSSSLLKMILVLLGLGAMVAFIVVFLTVLYFFFLRSD